MAWPWDASVYQTILAQPGRLPDTLKEPDVIVTAIDNRDGDTAARLCAQHVRKAADTVLDSMGS
jgi:DNA-binding GntR family transcriptional regulator